MESLPQNILRKDLTGRFTFVNRRFAATLNKPVEDIIGRTDFDLFPRELAAQYQADDHRVLEGGGTFETYFLCHVLVSLTRQKIVRSRKPQPQKLK